MTTAATMSHEAALDRHAQLGEEEQAAARRLNHARLRLKAELAAANKTREAALARVAGLEQEAVTLAEAGLRELASRATQDLVQIRLSEVHAVVPVWQLAGSTLFSELRERLEKAPDSSFETYDPEAVAQARADVADAEEQLAAIKHELASLKSVIRS